MPHTFRRDSIGEQTVTPVRFRAIRHAEWRCKSLDKLLNSSRSTDGNRCYCWVELSADFSVEFLQQNLNQNFQQNFQKNLSNKTSTRFSNRIYHRVCMISTRWATRLIAYGQYSGLEHISRCTLYNRSVFNLRLSSRSATRSDLEERVGPTPSDECEHRAAWFKHFPKATKFDGIKIQNFNIMWWYENAFI